MPALADLGRGRDPAIYTAVSGTVFRTIIAFLTSGCINITIATPRICAVYVADWRVFSAVVAFLAGSMIDVPVTTP